MWTETYDSVLHAYKEHCFLMCFYFNFLFTFLGLNMMQRRILLPKEMSTLKTPQTPRPTHVQYTFFFLPLFQTPYFAQFLKPRGVCHSSVLAVAQSLAYSRSLVQIVVSIFLRVHLSL